VLGIGFDATSLLKTQSHATQPRYVVGSACSGRSWNERCRGCPGWLMWERNVFPASEVTTERLHPKPFGLRPADAGLFSARLKRR